MQKSIYSLFTKSALLVVLSFTVACGGPKVNRTLKKAPELTPEESAPKTTELEPTLSEEKIQRIFKNLAYEAPEKTIQTKQATLHLQQVKMKNVKMKYDPVQRNFMVQGQVFILDENKNEIADNTFSLAAVHAADDSVFRLSKTDNVKVNSKEKPVVRAKVTCLSVHSDDSMDCSNAVVDFFIAYKKKIYTEQMETQSPTNPVSPKEPKTGAFDEDAGGDAFGDAEKSDDIFGSDNSENGKLQSESEEESVLGRYQGQVQNTDLSKEFDDDDDIQTEIKPLPKKEPKKKKEKKPKTDADKKDSAKDKDKDKEKDPKNSGTPAPTLPLDPKNPTPQKPDVKVDTGAKPATPAKEEEDDESDDDQDDGNAEADDDIVGTKINSESATTSDGKIRPLNQAIGLPNKGSLRNATSMVDRQKSTPGFFEVFNPARAFATYEMAEMITRMGKKLTSAFSKKLNLSDISQKRGGALSPHLSHQIGMDADIAYPSNNDKVKFPAVVHGGSYDSSVYSIEKTYELLKFTYSQKDIKVDRIFIDRKIKKVLCDYAKAKGELNKDKELVQRLFNNMEHVDGHGDHFHLRLRCTPAHPACRDKVYAKVETCG